MKKITVIFILFFSIKSFSQQKDTLTLSKLKASNLTLEILKENGIDLKQKNKTDIDYYKLKEIKIEEIRLAYEEIIKEIKNQINLLEFHIAERQESNDTNSVKILTEGLEITTKGLKSAEEQMLSDINLVTSHFNAIIKIEYETTAFYSKPNYEGNEYIVTGNEKLSKVGFEPMSIRVARNCKIQVFPYEKFRAHRNYSSPTFSKSTPQNLLPNHWSESMISGGPRLRATSFKLVCN